MNLDQQLPGLLAHEAEHADTAPPTMAGVQVVVGRRVVRRRRRRVGLGALAGLCLVAGVAGGAALSGDGENEDGFIDGPTASADVAAVGIDRPAWELVSVEPDVQDADFMDWDWAVTTFHATDPADIAPYISVTVLEDGPTVDVGFAGTEVDLGPEVTTAYAGDDSVGWVQVNGDYAFIESLEVAREDLIAYARQLAAAPIDLDTVAAPNGFPIRTYADVWEDKATLARTTYSTPDGTLEIEVTDQPAWIETVIDNEYLDFPADARVAVAPNVLGAGTALLRELDQLGPTMTTPGLQPPYQDALWRTPSGLQVRLTAFGPGADGVVRDVLANGGLVLLDESGEPLPPTVEPSTPSTTFAPGATLPIPATYFTAAGESLEGTGSGLGGEIMDIRIGRRPGSYRVTFAFSEGVPAWAVSGATSPATGECEAGPLGGGPAYLNVTLGIPGGGGITGPDPMAGVWLPNDESGGPPVHLTCAPYEGAAYFTVPLDAPAGFAVTEHLDERRLVVDIQR